MQDTRPFQIGAATTPVTNAVAATAQLPIPKTCDAVALYNSSSTATSYIRVTSYETATPPADSADNAPTTTTDFPIPPLAQIRIYVGLGYKFVRLIASAADGITRVTPGSGI